jgi:hypothetical protein
MLRTFTLTTLALLLACGDDRDRPPGLDAGASDAGTIDPRLDAGDTRVCSVAECESGSALTCDRQLGLDCTSFGASCGSFVNVDGDPFEWCDCGALAEGGGRCTGRRDAVLCEGGVGLPAECPEGLFCDATTDDPSGIGCFCDDVADGVCPDPGCTSDTDCTSCTPSCGGRACGDNGCGGSCGTCPIGQTCSSSGACVSSCTPSCAGRECGSDGCSGTCGSCSGSAMCNAVTGRCEMECVPSCEGRVCGGNGCGGSCGSCPAGRECKIDGSGCECPFFDTLSYVFTATDIDWTQTNVIALNVNHFAIDGTRGSTEGAILDMRTPVATVRVYGCEPHIEVRRTYALRGGVTCMFTDTVRAESIAIPAATASPEGGCTAPPL